MAEAFAVSDVLMLTRDGYDEFRATPWTTQASAGAGS